MGEARLRKKQDQYYGKIPKNGKGIVISLPLKIKKNGGFHLKSSQLDPHELRRAILFFDRIVWPKDKDFNVGSSIETDYLESLGILKRPRTNEYSGNAIEVFGRPHVEAFQTLEGQEPGQWCLAEGEDSFVWDQRPFVRDRGSLVTLHRTIPIPEADMPIEDLLRFKEKRRDEFVRLSLQIDRLFIELENSKDLEFALSATKREISQCCDDAIRVAHESRWRFRISDLGLGTSVNLSQIASLPALATSGVLASSHLDLPHLTALLAGAASFISLNVGASFGRTKVPESPFRVVGRLHNEVI